MPIIFIQIANDNIIMNIDKKIRRRIIHKVRVQVSKHFNVSQPQLNTNNYDPQPPSPVQMSLLPVLVIPCSNVNISHNAQMLSVINDKASEPNQLDNTEDANNNFNDTLVSFNNLVDGLHESTENISNDQYNLYSSESSNDDLEDNCNFHINNKRMKLAKWAIQTNQTRHQVRTLLEILREDDPSLPLDKRTLCKVEDNSDICDMGKGKYLHFGIKSALNNLIKKYCSIKSCLYIDICIDGVPVSKSSGRVLWPILINFVGYNDIYIVGVYLGTSKPNSIDIYLKRFVTEFLDHNISYVANPSNNYLIKIRAIVADAPARAFLLNIKTFSGYNSCHKCHVKGSYILHRITFPGTCFIPRTNTNFKTKQYPNHHNDIKATEIEKLPIDLVSNVPVDYMHASLLGVTLQMLLLWIGIKRKPFSLSQTIIDQLSYDQIVIGSQLPTEFSRKPRELKYLRRYKATELRQLVLYTLPVIASHCDINLNYYNHFLKLHCALRILCSPDLCVKQNNVASILLKEFVGEFPALYEPHTASFNVHSLLHLSEDVLHFKSALDSFSSFKFENFNQILKKLSKSGNLILEQIHNRYMQKLSVDINVQKVGDHKRNQDGTYKYIYKNNYKFSTSAPNNYAYYPKSNLVLLILKILETDNKFIFYGQQVNNLQPIYKAPINSTKLGLFKSNSLKFENIKKYNFDNDTVKIAKFELNGTHFFLSLLH